MTAMFPSTTVARNLHGWAVQKTAALEIRERSAANLDLSPASKDKKAVSEPEKKAERKRRPAKAKI